MTGVPETKPEGQKAPTRHLIGRVGGRVRAEREKKNIPRRVLSETSGVSPRYLAQLEAGEGNISIALLDRIAQALDCRIEWFFADDDPLTWEAVRIAELYRAASTPTRQSVFETLTNAGSDGSRKGRICLVGLRGAGKSTLGEMAGKRLGLPFVELNKEIESQSGMPVGEVMALYGEEGFRRLEATAIERVIREHDRLILAVAGGIVSEPATYDKLLGSFHAIWIKAEPDDHMARVRAQGDERPMAGNPAAMAQLKTILLNRESMYDRACAQLDTAGRRVEQSLQDLLDLIEARGFLA